MAAICAGVLALQGSVEPHLRALSRCGVDPIELRRPDQLDQITHLVLPGGESTTLHHLMELHSLSSQIPQRVATGQMALLGTCAGAILMGRECQESPPRWNLIDVEFQRNDFGRQVHSFIEPIEWIAGPDLGTSEGIFIRAPRIGLSSPAVEVLATLGSEAVAVRQDRCVACTFHPELTGDDRVHQWFLRL